MPIVQPGSKVLVSGANGFIAIWVVRTLLEKGYVVHGTVRSQEKGNHLKTVFKEYGDKLKLFIVEDITKDGAFDEVVKGVDAIEHTASPFHLKADDPQELIGPAVQGTVGILQSAIKYGSSLKRVVVTSSCAAIFEDEPDPRTYDENHWNEKSIKQVEELGRNAPNAAKYQASKTLAEKAAWDLWRRHKDTIDWDLVVLNPPYVFGPVIHEVTAIEALNTSALLWYNTVVLGQSLGTDPGYSWIDVRDLAEAHARAIQNESVGGERIIVCSSTFFWQQWVNAAHVSCPSFSNWLPARKPEARNIVASIQYDTKKEEKLLGIKFKDIEEATRDILEDFKKRGWLKAGTP